MSSEQAHLRRAVIGGVRREDVSRALAELAKRNLDLGRELASARSREASLAQRLQTSEESLSGFQSVLGHMTALLDMAEERAARIEEEARERAAAGVRELESLQEARRQAVSGLEELRSRLDGVIRESGHERMFVLASADAAEAGRS